MQTVSVPAHKWLGPPLAAFAVLLIQMQAGQSLAMALAISLAAGIHVTATTLRDAEFRALTAHRGLNRTEIASYGCTLVFDALLLFGLLAGAGQLMPYERFASLALIIAALLVPLTLLLTRKAYAPDAAPAGLTPRHWAPPVFLALGTLLVWLAQGIQMPVGNQPFAHLALASILMVTLDREIPLTGIPRRARHCAAGGAALLLIWNYLQIS